MSDGFARRWNQVAYDGETERRLDSILMAPGAGGGAFSGLSGKRIDGSGLTVTVSGSPEMVNVSPGGGVIFDPGHAAGGPWTFEIPEARQVSLGARPASGMSRRDWVVAQLQDPDSGFGTERSVTIVRYPGSPGATPSDPTPPPGAVFLILATLIVPATGTVTVTPTSARTAAAGGVVPVATTDGLVGYAGQCVWNGQRSRLEVHDGTKWSPVDRAQPTRLLTRTTSFNVATGTNVPLGGGINPAPGDQGNASGITLSGGTLTVSEAGMYWVMIRFVVPVITSGTWTVGLIVNGASNPLADPNLYDQEARGSNLSYMAHLSLAAGTTLQMFMRQVSGSTQSVSGDAPSRWEVRRVGDL